MSYVKQEPEVIELPLTKGLKPPAIKTKRIEMTGEWEGYWFVTHANPTIEVVADLLSGNLDRAIDACKSVIMDWNFIGSDGEKLPAPKDGGIRKVPSDLFWAMAQQAGNTPFETPPNS